ncbi:DUF1345 domain-containing protein [Curtobacterium sp. MCBD17_019]|uniref:DUF1345 domain-containing protein n=1 Tax=Curtobacterium sp. MCBD17_019 TaxID=2175669 RepID=UPI000DAA1F24|nr:DUF1345 domain-containing protein [Curtobacterium sp. MCBD17_019]PZE75849.1 DUF1345 domain-containing protein [Curtobacterium sp. MCBD17_019]
MQVGAHRGRSRARLVAMVVVGVAAGVVAFVVHAGLAAWAIGWTAACLTYLVRVWTAVHGLDGVATRIHALREDPTRRVSHVLLVLAAVGSLFIVGMTLIGSKESGGLRADLLAALAVLSVALSWILIHTLFMLRYAVQYYGGDAEGGIDFNQRTPPAYGDFAYFAFNLGMTFQVSDTAVTSTAIRRVVLRHCLLAYVFGSVILATLVNLVAGLG